MDHVVDGPDAHRRRQRVRPRHRPGHGDHRPRARPAAADRQVPGLRLVEPPLPPGVARPGGGRPHRRPPDRLGRPAGRAAAVPRHVLGPDARSRSTATPRSSRPSASPCSTSSRPAPGPRAGPSRPRASPAPATTATPSGTPRPSCCRSSPTRFPEAAADALRWRHSTLPAARAAGRRPSACTGAAFPWRTIAGEECSGYWPAGHRRLPRQRRHRRRRRPLRRRHRRRGLRARRRATSSWWRRPGCGARSATTTATAGSASPASPGPTSTARWPTTTSTRTSWPSRTCGPRPTPPSATRSRPRRLGVDEVETCRWRAAAEAMYVPYDAELGVHPQAERFTDHEVWDFERHPARPVPAVPALPLLRPLPQAGGQAGRPGAGHAPAARTPSPTSRRPATSPTTRRITVRDSSLSAATQAVLAAEIGHLDLAYDYLAESARSTSRTCTTTPATACTWPSWPAPGSALVAGFGGLPGPGGPAVLRPPAALRTSPGSSSTSGTGSGTCA